MVCVNLTPNSEIGVGQENNNMENFLQTVGHQQLGTLAGFTACLTAVQAPSDKEYYLYEDLLAHKPNTALI